MSTTIDQRVVEMRFDNKQFESATATSMSTIDKLKQKLNFTGASKGLEEVSSAAKKVDMSSLGNAVEAVRVKFSSLQVIGVTALSNIANSAVNAGKRIVSALTIDPVMTGFQEYETQINAIQTILANTSSAGTTLGQVNAALDELNTYADKTIYNFTEMTRNIGTFTAAGVDLDTSVSAIKGIANLAAVSGSTSQQASTAMYQLSQAIAAGRVSLEDWNSVVNAGMGGKVFQDALKNTAKAMGITVDESKSFRESISAAFGQESWLTSDVLLNTLKQFTGDLNDAELAAMGFSDTQIASIQQMAVTANDAATKVKTVSQLWDTMKESVQSGWTQTWEILVGDFEEAKTLLTEVSDAFGGIIGQSAEARNTLLYDALTSNWKKVTDGITEAGLSAEEYQEKVSEVAKQQGVDVDAMVKEYGSLEAAFKNGAISSTVLSDALIEMTGTAEENQKKLSDLAGEYDSSRDIMDALTKAGYDLTDQQELLNKVNQGQTVTLNDLTDAQLRSLGYTDEQIESIRQLSANLELSSGSLQEFIDNISKPMGRENLIDALRISFRSLVDIFGVVHDAWIDVFPPTTSDQLLGITESVKEFALALRPSADTLDKLGRAFKGLFSIFSLAKQAISAVLRPFGDLFGVVGNLSGGILELAASFGDWLSSLDQAAKSGNVFSALSDGIADVLHFVTDGINGIINNVGGLKGIFSSIGDGIVAVFDKVFEVVGGVVNWIRENISAGDIFAGLAGGGIFALAQKLSGVVDKIKDLFESFGSMGEGVGSTFSSVLDSVNESLSAFTQGIQVASLVGIAVAIALLSSSLRKISEIDPVAIGYSLATIAGMMRILNSGMNSLSKTMAKFNPKGLTTASIAMIAMAEAINILASAMQKLASLNLGQLAQGLFAIGVMMAELVIALKFLDGVKISLKTSVAMIALAEACKMLSEAMTGFAGLSWEEIAKGLIAMGGALTELVAALGILQKVAGFKSLLGSVGILVIVQALDEISAALASIGSLSWEQIAKGLVGMGAALTELVAALGILSTVGGFSSLLAGGAILTTVQSLDEISAALASIGSLSWEEIGKGLVGMGGALAEIGTVTGLLGKLAGFSGLLGGGAILLAVQSLDEIANALGQIGALSWDEIARGLTGMGGALLEVAGISGALGVLAGFSGILGGAAIWTSVQGLDQLANALIKFGDMSWDEIGRGLVAMGGALLEVSAISGGLGVLAGFAGILGGASIWVTVQGLDDLANALQKFASMSWDEIGRGLSAMGGALGEVALGGILNTFSGIGAASIASMVEPLAGLADSVKKWISVEVPEGLGNQLGELADGVGKFTFTGWGSDSIATVAEPLGTMADSVMKWSGVTVPEDIGTQLQSLADGISAFTWQGWGADALATAAPAMDQLADAVGKWSNINVPSDLPEQLKGLADGVGSFTWAFAGGWSMNAIIGPLGDLASSVSKWSDVNVPDTLEEDLTGLANGVKAFTWAFMGGFSMSTVIDPLAKLPDSVKKWNDVAVPDNLEEDLTGLANGVKAFTWAFVGGWSIDTISEPLGELADSVKKWKGVSVPEGIEEGLTGISNGVKSFNWSLTGSSSLATIAAPIGDLASSIEKWSGVTIPADLGDQLSGLADGVKAFNFAGWGSDAIAASTTGVGDMASAVKKWNGVTVPDNLGDQLKTLASGVKSFNFSGSGAEAIAAAGVSLGEMATSVKKWTDVSVPENLGDNLKSLASGVSSFNFSGWGADNISASVDGVGNMAGAVKKWADVDVPDGLESTLNGLAKGVSAFNFAGWGADAMAASVAGVGDMAGAIKKWEGVDIPTDLGENLQSLAGGVSAFNFSGWGADTIASLATPLSTLADSIDKWSDISVPESIGDDLSSLADGVKSFTFGGWGADTLITVADSLGSLGDAIAKLSGTEMNISDLGADLTNLSVGVRDLVNSGLNASFTSTLTTFLYTFTGEDVSAAVSNIGNLLDVFSDMSSINMTGFTTFQNALDQLGEVSITGLVESLESGAGRVSGAITTIVKGMETALSGAASVVGSTAKSVGTAIGENIVTGTQEKLSVFSTTVSAILSTQASSLSSKTSSFRESGTALANGLIAGFKEALSNLSSEVSSSMESASSAISSKSASFQSSGTAISNALITGVRSNSQSLLDTFDTMISAVISALSNKQNEFKTTAQTLMTAFISGVSSKKPEAERETTTLVSGILKVFETNGPKFNSSGKELVSQLVSGIAAKKSDASDAFSSVLSSMITSIRDQYTGFYNAGMYLVQGFANGISENTYIARAKAQAMANAARSSAEAALGVQSPSRVFYGIGAYVVEGFANGLEDNLPKVANAGEELAKTVADSASGLNIAAGLNIDVSDISNVSGTMSEVLESLASAMQNTLYSGGTIVNGEMNSASAPEMAKPLIGFFETLGEALRVMFTETYMETWLAIGMAILEYIRLGMVEQWPVVEEQLGVFSQWFYEVIRLHQPVFFAAGEYVIDEFAAGLSFAAPRAIAVASGIGGQIASALAGGFSDGMMGSMDDIASAVQAVTDTAISQMQSALKINSPSKVTMSFGSSFSEGFAKGISNGEDMTSSAAISMVQNTITKIAEAVDQGIDAEPTIRPVLDLSGVEDGTKRISAMFSRNQALSIGRSMNRSSITSPDQNGAETSSDGGNTFNFTQNNYSPKALSRVDIYRQTNNQFSAFKRAVRV